MKSLVSTSVALAAVLVLSSCGDTGTESPPHAPATHAQEAVKATAEAFPDWAHNIKVAPDTHPDFTVPAPPIPNYLNEPEAAWQGTGAEWSMVRLADGGHAGSKGQRFPRPGLSLIKLYIADYVDMYGTAAEKVQAEEMLRDSDDDIATELWEKYPSSVSFVAATYDLQSTSPAKKWGYSLTSVYDVVRFLAIVLTTKPDSLVVHAMRHAAARAADGYHQDFGTTVIPGVVGSKWGWSNDRMVHNSVSFGPGFVIAAFSAGDADDLTTYVEEQMPTIAPLLPAGPVFEDASGAGRQ